MKVCKKCNANLIQGENIYSSLYKNRDYICKSCSIKKTNQYFKTDKGKKLLHKYSKTKTFKDTIKRWRNKIKGVYGIYENGICLYIGESSRVNMRFSEHKYYTKSQRDNPQKSLYEQLQHHNFILGLIEECDNHKEREKYYIDKYKPLYNSQLKGTTTT